jgi:hypothetical membrane protein
MKCRPWWGRASSIAAPIMLVAGFTLAAIHQPTSFDSWRDTISALAAGNATDSWIMTVALYGLGLCHIITAMALYPAARLGRSTLAFGGFATLGVAAFPTNTSGTPPSHMLAAGLAFGALTVWPAFARQKSNAESITLQPRICFAATAVLSALLLWFTFELAFAGSHVGLAERVVAVAQSLWPLLVANSPNHAAMSTTKAE